MCDKQHNKDFKQIFMIAPATNRKIKIARHEKEFETNKEGEYFPLKM